MENQQPQNQQPQLPPDPNRQLYFTIKHSHAEIMIQTLAKLPYEQIHEFIHDLQAQYGQQIMLAQEPAPISEPPSHVSGKPFVDLDKVGKVNMVNVDPGPEPEPCEEELACAPAPPSGDET
jgi:hypothetical protein